MFEDDLFSFPLLRTLRRLEWIAVIIIVAIDLWRRFIAQATVGKEVWIVFGLYLLAIGTLSWLYGRDVSAWSTSKRVIWIALQLALVTLASIFGVCGPLLFLNILIAAKTVLLIDAKRAAMVVVANVLLFALLVVKGTDVLSYSGAEFAMRWTEVGLQLALFTLLNVILVLIAGATVREARSRRRIEELAEQNEALTKEIERNRIARDLHDTLGHTLVSLGIQLEVMEEFRALDPERTQKALQAARKLTDSLINDVRRTVQSIRDPNFDLDNSLRELVQQVHGNDKIAVQMNVAVKTLPNKVGHELFCIVKECLTNAQKHAHASTVNLTIEQSRKTIELSVADDGCGFHPTEICAGSGLSNIRERVRILAGNLSVESEPNRGTQIKVSIPL